MSKPPVKHTLTLLASVASLLLLLLSSSRVAHAAPPVLRLDVGRPSVGATRLPVIASLNDDAGRPIADARIVFYVDGDRDGESRTDHDGHAEWRVRRELAAGSHTIEAALDPGHSPLRAVTTVVIAPANVKLEVPQPARVGEPLSLAVQVTTPAGQPVADVPVTFLVNDRPRGSVRTDAEGRAAWQLRDSLDAGAYHIQAVSGGKLPLLAARADASLTVAPAQLDIRTVPALPNASFSLGQQIFKAGDDGVARISIDRVGVYSITVASGATISSVARAEFANWSDGIYTSERTVKIPARAPLQAGFNLHYLVTPEFVQAGDVAVDPARISSLTLMSSTGRRTTLQRVEPVWLQGSYIVGGPDGLEEREVSYAVDSAIVDGADVVNQSQQRFVPGRPGEWKIPVLFYSIRVSGRDALFGFPSGRGVRLTYPDGHTQWFPLRSDGQASVDALARGSYHMKLDGPGLAPTRPLVLARSQDVPVLLISYLDLTVIFGFLGLLALSLLLLGRGPRWLGQGRSAGLPEAAVSAPEQPENATLAGAEE